MKYPFNVKASFGTLIEKSFNFILPAKILFSESQNLLEVIEFLKIICLSSSFFRLVNGSVEN